MTHHHPLSAQQRNSIRATARQEWMVTRNAAVAIVSAQLVTCGMVGGEQLPAAHKLVADLIKHWSENAIANPDAAPMWGEPGLDEMVVQVAESDVKRDGGGE